MAEARAALGCFERLGATRDADAAAGLIRSLGQTAGRSWPIRQGSLTKREEEVLSLLFEGCSNQDIAARLYISKRTAEHHVASILSKLGLRSRAEAAAHARRELSEDPYRIGSNTDAAGYRPAILVQAGIPTRGARTMSSSETRTMKPLPSMSSREA